MSETAPLARRPWHRVMAARDPGQEHRTSTPLELLFDLCFVVAISRAAAELHHAITESHALVGYCGYALAFFAIWWAWMNFTWFASAFDTDDVLYRVLTVIQMAGALVLAVGIDSLVEHYDLTLGVVGYLIMRLSMVVQWLRAARESSPEYRPTCYAYALGITVVQVLWVALAFVPPPWILIGFGVLVIAELAVPVWAESRGRTTSWHPEHIAERYGLLTLIVLGEVILGVTTAIGGAVSAGGASLTLILIALGGLLLVFALWWTYFLGGDHAGLRSLRVGLMWGYGHYAVFAAIAALGAGLEAAVDASQHAGHVGSLGGAFAVAGPVVVVLVVISQLRKLSWGRTGADDLVVVVASVLLLACAALAPVDVGLAVLAMGAVLTGTLVTYLVRGARRHAAASPTPPSSPAPPSFPTPPSPPSSVEEG